jgi:hypothetical protein
MKNIFNHPKLKEAFQGLDAYLSNLLNKAISIDNRAMCCCCINCCCC